MKKMVLFSLTISSLVLLISCQAVFTYSPIEVFKRDASTLSDDAQVSYAEDLLTGGSVAEITEAYGLISDLLDADPENAELNLLAADLAMGASGLEEVMLDAVSMIGAEEGADPDALMESLETVETEMLVNVVDHLEAAEAAGAEISDDQYVNAAAAQVLVVADAAGGVENVDWENDPDILQALEWAGEGGVDLEALLAGA